MATFEIPRDEVRQFLRVIRDTSKAVATLLRDTLKRIQENPGQFEELVKVPDFIARHSDVRVRKAKIQHRKHNFRLLFIHRTLPDGSELVYLFDAFPRLKGYAIDWDWCRELIGEPPPISENPLGNH
jgi:hypothetical protein